MLGPRTTAALVGLIVAGVVLPGVLPVVQPVDAQVPQRLSDPKVLGLLRERLTTLEELAQLRKQAYQSGEASLQAVLASQRAVQEARLELAGSAEDRVGVRAEMLENARAAETLARQLAAAAQGSSTDVLQARAHRLRAEADLILERENAVR
jgi:hypothetical protein